MKERLEELIAEGVNITKSVGFVNSSIKLSELRDRYLKWLEIIKEFSEKNRVDFSIASLLYENDNVTSTFGRGVGVGFDDEFSQNLLKEIRRETRIKLRYLRSLNSYFQKRIKEREIDLTFNKHGVLSRDDGKGKVSFERAGNRRKIIKFLANAYSRHDYQPPGEIQIASEGRNISATRKAIGNINARVRMELDIKRFIDSKRGSGYRINPLYRIKLT